MHGSSPRGRGTHVDNTGRGDCGRFIPAWAGNTEIELAMIRIYAVHPRVGGEHRRDLVGLALCLGSSPRGRGTLSPRLSEVSWLRFIPAWAGNTFVYPEQTNDTKVHPRVGGEHCPLAIGTGLPDGSSPRGRGTRRWTTRKTRRRRFIPAWAGNTCDRLISSQDNPVHPRVGGEHSTSTQVIRRNFGSSPRGRGTHRPDHDLTRFNRFIPAWAGNTVELQFAYQRHSVHPRVGGEHRLRPGIACSGGGSSPRGRGTHIHRKYYDDRCRFIPAWAGNTDCAPA